MWTGVVWIPVGSLGHPDHVGDKRVVEKVDECVEDCTLAISFKNVVDHFVWIFASVYGPSYGGDRRLLWDELVGMISW
jgi:hypothetical protein